MYVLQMIQVAMILAMFLIPGCSDDEGAAPPDSGSTTDTGGATPGPHRFGFLSAYGQRAVNLEWKKSGKDLVQSSSQCVRDLGARWARELFFIYPQSSTVDLMGEAALKQAQADGLSVVGVVAVDQTEFPSQKSQAMAWVSEVVKNYAKQVKYWQVHNEVGKKGRYEQASDYLELLKATSAAIRQGCADCKVVMGSTVPDESYFGALVTGGDALVDAYDAHLFDENHFVLLEKFVAKVRTRSTTKPMFLTEMATYSGKPAASVYPEQSEQQQAETLVKWYTRAFAAGAAYVFWSQLIEWYKFDNKEDGFFDLTGLVYNGLGKVVPGEVAGAKKQAYQSLKVYITKLDRFDSVKKLGEGSYRFTAGSKNVYVCWCSGSSGCALPSGLTGKRTVTDYQGKVTTCEASAIKLSASPVFIE